MSDRSRLRRPTRRASRKRHQRAVIAALLHPQGPSLFEVMDAYEKPLRQRAEELHAALAPAWDQAARLAARKVGA